MRKGHGPALAIATAVFRLFARRRFALVSSVLLFATPLAAEPTDVAVVLDGPWGRNAELLEHFHAELSGLLAEEFELRFPEAYRYEADWTASGIRSAVDRALANPDVDLVLALGLLSGHDLGTRGDLPKPGFAPFVVDARLQGIPLVEGRSGVKGFSYLMTPGGFGADLREFRELVDFERAVLLVQEPVLQMIQVLPEAVRAHGVARGTDLDLVEVSMSGADAVAAIPDGVDAVILAPLPRLSDPEFDALVAGLMEKKLPSFSLLGAVDVHRGILAGTTPAEEFSRRARRTALDIQRVLLGAEAGELPVLFVQQSRFTLNMATARAIDARPSWKILSDAEVVDRGRKDVARVVDLAGAVSEAVSANLDLRVRERTLAAREHDVGIARSGLLPQIGLGSTGRWLDEDVASFSNPGWRWTGRATVSQVLWSDDARTGVDLARHGLAVEKSDRDALRLDIAHEAATAYLSVLRAKTSERIQAENLRRTRENLELARVRREVGTSGPAEVYRWEGEVARSRRNVISANSQRNAAEIALNQILHRPLEEPFRTVEAELLDEHVGISDARLRAYLADPWSFRTLREFLVREAIGRSPEIQSLDEAVAARHRVRKNAERSFWMPTVGAEAELSRELDRGGVGETGSVLVEQGGSVATVELEPVDTWWSVGLSASIPLFEGARRTGESRQARERIAELERTRDAVAERIEQRVRTSMHRAGASWAAIDLSREESDAADRNLSLVQDAYARGVTSIVDLLDAQTNDLIAREGAGNAIFEFLIDLMEVERAAGWLVCLATPEKNEEFLERLEVFRDEREER